MRITREQASEYWHDPSQQIFGATPENLPGDPFEYYASGPFCGAVHPGPLRGVWIVDFAAKPDGRGALVEHGISLLREFWAIKKPTALMGFTREDLRPALAFIRRVGFKEVGRFPAENGVFVISKFGADEWESIQ